MFRDRRGGLIVCHLNVRSVLPKSDELGKRDGVVFGLSETWLDESIMDLDSRFSSILQGIGGGVMVYVPEQFKVVRRKTTLWRHCG